MPDLLRFTADAAAALRAAIAEAGGVEVFAVGDVDAQKRVVGVEVHARGTADQVNALPRARTGQVVIHNHPSGNVRPSPPDLEIAGRFGEDGVGFVIVDNAVTRAQWVVEPHARVDVAVDPDALEAFFGAQLPQALPGWEPRPGQAAMAAAVAEGFDVGGSIILEAGTGTGKSLAYLAPSALWALANDRKVIVSTYTRTLQGQLVADDLPLLRKVLPVRTAVLKGRGNYVCKRKLALAMEQDPSEGIRQLAAWAATSASGDVSEFGAPVDDEDWERVNSDTDQTLRARCPHFNTCFWYQARRTAAAAHVVVANHALLLADLSIKAADGQGILPKFDRVVIDEAHHLEEAVTGIAASRLGARAIVRAVNPAVGRGRRPGALARLADAVPEAAARAHEAVDALARVRDEARMGFELLAQEVHSPLRVRGLPPRPEFFRDLAEALDRAAARLGAVQAAVEDLADGKEIPPKAQQPLLDVGRCRKRLEEFANTSRAFLVDDAGGDAQGGVAGGVPPAPRINACRFLDPGLQGVVAVRAPIDVGPLVRSLLVEPLHARVFTSATLAVNGRIGHWLARVGLVEGEGEPTEDELADANVRFQVFESPFNYEEQAILALPRDLPAPDAPDWSDAIARVLVAAIEASRGGAFVLCTSHQAVAELSARVEAALGDRHAILRQGKGNRGPLLERFRQDRGAVLFGTDSFWEGVSVRGDGLRLVIIPRLPFRVPTEPVAEARYERIRAMGLDPFRAFALPEAVLKLRQGFGRLVRSQGDRGAVMVLDRRVHEAWYGKIFLASLPRARRVVGPSRVVLETLRQLYAAL